MSLCQVSLRQLILKSILEIQQKTSDIGFRYRRFGHQKRDPSFTVSLAIIGLQYRDHGAMNIEGEQPAFHDQESRVRLCRSILMYVDVVFFMREYKVKDLHDKFQSSLHLGLSNRVKTLHAIQWWSFFLPFKLPEKLGMIHFYIWMATYEISIHEWLHMKFPSLVNPDKILDNKSNLTTVCYTCIVIISYTISKKSWFSRYLLIYQRVHIPHHQYLWYHLGTEWSIW